MEEIITEPNFPESLDPRLERTVKEDRWDKKSFAKSAWKVPQFRKARDELFNVTDTAWAECEDLWALLNKANPKLLDEKVIRDDHKIDHAVNAALQDHPVYDELQLLTMGDPTGAALAVADLLPTVVEIFKRNKDLADKLKEQQERKEQQQKKLVEAANAESNGNEEGQQQAQAEADQIGEQIGEAEERLQEALEGAELAMGSAIGKGLEKALENQEDQQSLARGFDLSPAELSQQDPSARLKLAELMNNPRIRNVAKMIGALSNLVTNRTVTKKGIPHSMVGTKLGNDVEYLLGEQLTALDDPDRLIGFLADFVDGRLLQYDVEGKIKLGKGGIATGVDCSGSMGYVDPKSGISRLDWSISVVLVLYSIAVKEKRPFRAVFFNSAVKKKIELKNRNDVLNNIQAIASITPSGGTDFIPALNDLITGLEKEAGDTAQSDLVFITDGESYTDKAWMDKFHKRLDKIGGQVWGVAIDTHQKEPLLSICRGKVCSVSDLRPNTTRDLKTIFDGIATYRGPKKESK